MTLKNCPDCNREVSDRASLCFHCGRPLPLGKQKAALFVGVFLALFLGGVIAAIAQHRRRVVIPSPQVEVMPGQPEKSSYKEIKVNGKPYILVTEGQTMQAVPVKEPPSEDPPVKKQEK